MSQAERKRWMQAEADNSISRQTRLILMGEFAALRDGKPMRNIGVDVRLSKSQAIVVPCLGTIQVDHPEHMSLVACTYCGFCDLGKRKHAGLADWALEVCERSTEQALSLLTPYQQALKSGDNDAQDKYAQLIIDSGMHLPPHDNVLLDDRYIDGFWNISISPLHVPFFVRQSNQKAQHARRWRTSLTTLSVVSAQVLKVVYRDVWSATIHTIYSICPNRTAFLNLLQRLNRWVLMNMSNWTIMKGEHPQTCA